MRLLLDTHILLWATLTPDRLGAELQRDLAQAQAVHVSTVCVWEIAIKHALGRLHYPIGRIDEIIAGAGFIPLPITHAHAVAAGALPRLHQDPFDRMLVAQARLEGLVLVSADRAIRQYDVPLYGAG